MLLIDASTSLLQIGQTFNGDSSKGVGKRPFSMRIADQIKRQWAAIFDENHRPDSMRFGGHFSREYATSFAGKQSVLIHYRLKNSIRSALVPFQ